MLTDMVHTIGRGLTRKSCDLQEVGPYDVGWKPRKHSWVEKVSILFVDNPVGTGFSYVEEGANFTHNNAEIAADLLTFLKSFLNDKPEVRDLGVPRTLGLCPENGQHDGNAHLTVLH